MVQDTKLASDGLPAIGQGPWSRDKLHFVSRFAEMFSTGMKNRWHTRLYVDLFAGPGLCLDKTTGEEFEGSPMLALGCKTPFTHLYLNDQNHDFVNALKQRQEAKFPDSQVSYYGLDCNEAASAIYRSLPSGALVLCFIDPWTYEVTFDSLAALCQHRSIDLIVTFHSTAIKRNAHHEIAAVDKFLGDETWREEYFAAEGDPSRPHTHILIETFTASLRKRLGFTHFGEPEVIRNTNSAPMFYLLFASRHPRGLDFWSKSSNRTSHGQRKMF